MRFTEWLQQKLAEAHRHDDYVKYHGGGGKVVLYHYLNGVVNPPEKITLDPNRFGANGYTRGDVKASSLPRVFFYVDVGNRERWFSNAPLYEVEVPASQIYDLLADPKGFKAANRLENNGVLQFGPLLYGIKEAGYKGVYYKPDMHVVNWFYPIEVHLSDANRQANAA